MPRLTDNQNHMDSASNHDNAMYDHISTMRRQEDHNGRYHAQGRGRGSHQYLEGG